MIQDMLTDAETRMAKAMDALRARPQHASAPAAPPRRSLDRITVEYYGTPTPLNQLAGISAPEARMLVIQPWDRGTIAGDREGDPEVGPRPQPEQRRPGHPPRHPAADRGAAQAARQAGPSAGRRGQGRRPQHPARRHPPRAQARHRPARSPRTTSAAPRHQIDDLTKTLHRRGRQDRQGQGARGPGGLDHRGQSAGARRYRGCRGDASRMSPRARIPRHVAIIMDGNGRWAAQRGLPRIAGHEQGTENIRRITYAAGELGIEYLTLWAFSTENWRRPRRRDRRASCASSAR